MGHPLPHRYYCGHYSTEPIYYTDKETGFHYCKECGEKEIDKEKEAAAKQASR